MGTEEKQLEIVASKPKTKRQSAVPSWINVLVEYGPILLFFGVYYHYAPADSNDMVRTVFAAIRATSAFILAAIIALIISRFLHGRFSKMLVISTLLIVGFGTLTILLADPFWIQVKPTALYIFFGIVLLIGWLRGKALLQWLLAAAFEGLDDDGWLKLSRNWAFFFFLLALLNEVLRHFYNAENGGFGTWAAAKIWVFMPLSFLFTFAQLPMLLKHGLAAEAVKEEETTLPPA